MRVWHDSAGRGAAASWFLKYVIVRDLQTGEKSYFICQQWLAVEKDDGRVSATLSSQRASFFACSQVERVLPTAGELQKQEFSYLLSKQAYHSVSDGHLWFSIFSRPVSSTFTRVQRCTCCFVLLCVTMLLNILYYDQAAAAKTQGTGLTVGPLFVTSEQVGIGVVVELLSFLPSLLLLQMFRRLRPRHSHRPKKGSSWTLPWWCLFVAYGLSLIIAGVSVFFVIVRGIEFGDLKVQKWLTSLLTGFFSSILLIQPIKVSRRARVRTITSWHFLLC